MAVGPSGASSTAWPAATRICRARARTTAVSSTTSTVAMWPHCMVGRVGSGELVGPGDVLAEDPAAGGRGHRRHHLPELREVAAGMVGVRVVARPEEAVLADQRHQSGDRALVRVGRDVALPLEVVRRLLGEAHGGAQGGA